MASRTATPKTVTLMTGMVWWEALLCLLAGLVGGVIGAPWTGLLCALVAGIAFGVWRGVRFLGALLDYANAWTYQDEDETTI